MRRSKKTRTTYTTVSGETRSAMKDGARWRHPKGRQVSAGPVIHLCHADGCNVWGTNGLGPPLVPAQTWWCDYHTPPAFYEGR